MSRPKIRYPRGRLTAGDEGALAMTMLVTGNTLVIDFGKPVAWIGLGLQEVRDLRERLEKYEKELQANVGRGEGWPR